MNLAAKARAIEPRTGRSPWDGHEFGRGYAVLSLPLDSGHLLGLRVFPQNDFAPYVSVWHRPPGDGWAIYVDGPSLETACPRYWGPATRSTALASIEVDWTGPNDLRVSMAGPELEWTLSMGASPPLRSLNAVDSALPRWTWRVAPLLRFREWVAQHVLGYGDIRLSFTSASGHEMVLLARENYRVESSSARLDGRHLGQPVTLEENPTVGDVPLPTAPSFVFAEAHAPIVDRAEYRRTKEQLLEG